jgi:hypothetical protein
MRHFNGSNSSLSLTFLAFGLLLLAAPVARGQGQRATDERLNATKLDDGDRRTLQNLAAGREECTDAHKALLDKAAKWFIYRLTYKENQYKSSPEAAGDTMANLVKDVSQYIVAATPQKSLNENQKKFMKAFADALVIHIKKVLINPVPIARVNAAIVLSRLGDTGVEEVAAHMCDVLEGKGLAEGTTYDDTVKLYALIGLKNLFKAQALKDGKFESKDLERRCIQDVVTFLARKPAYGSSAPAEEIEAFRYIRREAIRALGWLQVPIAVKDAIVEKMPAVELARIIVNPNILTPAASLSEQVEAGISLCKLKNGRAPERYPYQQDYAAFFVAQLVVKFGTQANAELNNAGSTTDWKYSAYRLNEALTEMEKDSKGRSDYIKEMVGRASRIAKSIQEGKGESLAPLSDFLEQKKPPAMQMFKGNVDQALTVVAPAAEK